MGDEVQNKMQNIWRIPSGKPARTPGAPYHRPAGVADWIVTAVYALYAMAFGLVFFMGLIKGLTDPRVFSMPSFFVILACFIFLTMAVFKPGLRVITRLVAALHLLLGLPLAFFLGKVNEATRGYSDLNELLLVLVLPPSIVLFAAVIEHFQGRKRSHA